MTTHFKPSLGYHGTNAAFNEFSLDFAARPGMALNGHLGVWLATSPTDGQRFGALCLTVALNTQKSLTIPLHDLKELHKQLVQRTHAMTLEDALELGRQTYIEYRERLTSQGIDTLYIQEDDGAVDMLIGLVPSRLEILDSVPSVR